MGKEKNSEYILPEFFCVECKTQLIDIAYYDAKKGFLCEKCAWNLK